MFIQLDNGLDIAYETFGDASNPAILLIMGLGMQLIAWPVDFCQALAKGGFYVIRFDNRDVGLSSKLDHHHSPKLLNTLLRVRYLKMTPKDNHYRLEDMAHDTIELLSELNIQQAHIVGASMGGMIGQIMAAQHPDRILSLSLAMTNSGNPALPLPKFKYLLPLFLKKPNSNMDQYIEHHVNNLKMYQSPAYPQTEKQLREKTRNAFNRCYYPKGFVRQLNAIILSGDRVHHAALIKAPTLIIQGVEDKLNPISYAYDLEQKITHAKLHLIEGMGHDLPPKLIDYIAHQILEHIASI